MDSREMKLPSFAESLLPCIKLHPDKFLFKDEVITVVPNNVNPGEVFSPQTSDDDQLVLKRHYTWPRSNSVRDPIKEFDEDLANRINEELGLNEDKANESAGKKNAWGKLSYADLICRAIDSSPEKRLTLAQIYEWMVRYVPYFKDKGDRKSSVGWKNSVRHNLSLHDQFVRVRDDDSKKTSWWTLSPDVTKSNNGKRKRRVSAPISRKLTAFQRQPSKTAHKTLCKDVDNTGSPFLNTFVNGLNEKENSACLNTYQSSYNAPQLLLVQTNPYQSLVIPNDGNTDLKMLMEDDDTGNFINQELQEKELLKLIINSGGGGGAPDGGGGEALLSNNGASETPAAAPTAPYFNNAVNESNSFYLDNNNNADALTAASVPVTQILNFNCAEFAINDCNNNSFNDMQMNLLNDKDLNLINSPETTSSKAARMLYPSRSSFDTAFNIMKEGEGTLNSNMVSLPSYYLQPCPNSDSVYSNLLPADVAGSHQENYHCNNTSQTARASNTIQKQLLHTVEAEEMVSKGIASSSGNNNNQNMSDIASLDGIAIDSNLNCDVEMILNLEANNNSGALDFNDIPYA